jgi:hypothetical protein
MSRALSDDLAASTLRGDSGRAHPHHPIYTITKTAVHWFWWQLARSKQSTIDGPILYIVYILLLFNM